MKLFSWAQSKLLPSTSLHKHQHNADCLLEISTPNLTCGERRASRDTHAEVLTIGTLGMGSLLSREEEEEEEEEEEQEEEEEEEEEGEAHFVCRIADLTSPNRRSMSSNRASTSSNRASTSSNRASISSNRESVSSVDIQKLQEELQKILYFKLGQEQKGADINRKSNVVLEGSKAKAKKKKKKKEDRQGSGCYINDMNADGKSHVPSERGSMRGVLPLHNFLEMPMDNTNNNSTRPSYKLLSKTQYLLLLQSLKSKLLRYTSPTRVKLSSSLFEKLVKPKVNRDLHHGNTMDKMLHLLRKLMNKRPQRRSQNGQGQSNNDEDKPKCIKEVEKDEEEEEEESLKWALAKSCGGSERFLNYIASTMAHAERDKKSLVNDENLHHHYPYQLHCKEEGRLQLMLATSPSLDNECWIKTDDEYLVLEL